MAYKVHEYEKKGKTFYEYRIYYMDPMTGKDKEVRKRGFKGKKECRLAAEAKDISIREGYTEENVSLKTFMEYWLNDHKKDSISRSTYENKEQQIRLHIIPYFKDVNLKDIKPMMYQQFINEMADQGYSRSTIENNHWILHAVLDKAVAEKKIKDNPAKSATLKGKKKSEDEGLKFIDSAEIQNVLKAAYQYNYIYYIYLKALIETGLRKGEAAALQWNDIDLVNNTITINKSLDFKYKQFSNTKTYNSKRVIPIPERMVQDLKNHLKYQNQNKLALNDIYKHDLNLVFCRNDGDFLPKSTLANAFSRILKKAGLQSYPIHSLRHTHAVMALESGMDMKTLQNRLGHGSYEVTANVYSHVSNRMKEETMKAYEEKTNAIFNL